MSRRALDYLKPYCPRLAGIVAISLVSTGLSLWLPYLTKALVDQALIGLGEFRRGDYVVVVAGTPANSPGATNTLRMHQLGSLVQQ